MWNLLIGEASNGSATHERGALLAVHIGMPLVDTSIVAAHLAEAIRFPTIAPRAPDSDATTFATLHEYLARTYPRLHAQTVRDIVGTRSLHYEWRSKDASASHVVLMGHLDVVPALPGTEALWAYAP